MLCGDEKLTNCVIDWSLLGIEPQTFVESDWEWRLYQLGHTPLHWHLRFLFTIYLSLFSIKEHHVYMELWVSSTNMLTMAVKYKLALIKKTIRLDIFIFCFWNMTWKGNNGSSRLLLIFASYYKKMVLRMYIPGLIWGTNISIKHFTHFCNIYQKGFLPVDVLIVRR